MFRGEFEPCGELSAGHRPGVLRRILLFVPGWQPAFRQFFCFGRCDERNICALGQRDFKPAGAVGVAAAGLSARLLDRMRNVFAPLRLRMVFAGVGKNAELTVFGGSEREASWVLNVFHFQRMSVR